MMLCRPPVDENIHALQHHHSKSHLEHHFAVKGQKTAKVWLFLRRLDLQKSGVSGAEPSSLAVVSLQITAKAATALCLPVGAI
jgi:hypothetical protein